jgi:hypothetical protein
MLLLWFSAGTALAQQNGSGAAASTLRATHAKGSIKLDGRLDDDAWREAEMVAELVQQSPKPGEPSPYKTKVRVLVMADNIYFGFECTDPDLSKIGTHTMMRDGDLGGDDTVAIVLDAYGDRRTGYYFRMGVCT